MSSRTMSVPAAEPGRTTAPEKHRDALNRASTLRGVLSTAVAAPDNPDHPHRPDVLKFRVEEIEHPVIGMIRRRKFRFALLPAAWLTGALASSVMAQTPPSRSRVPPVACFPAPPSRIWSWRRHGARAPPF